MPNELLTAGEIALELRCSKAHVYRLLNGKVRGRTILPHLALGRKKVVRRSSFEAWQRLNESGAIVGSDSNINALGAVQ
jgi:hypothetical protein